MHAPPLRRFSADTVSRVTLAVSLAIGLAGALVLLTGAGPFVLQRFVAGPAGAGMWRETVRPLLIAGTLLAFAVAGTLGLGGSARHRAT